MVDLSKEAIAEEARRRHAAKDVAAGSARQRKAVSRAKSAPPPPAEHYDEPPEQTPAEVIRQELAARELRRRYLLHFIQHFHPRYKAGWVHRLICAKLEQFVRDVAAEKSPRLMLFMPPRSGKSEIVSKMFPAWLLGHHPEFEIISCSYAVSLPLDFSRAIKNTMNSQEYRALFADTKLDRNAQAAERWMTTRNGGYVAAGVSGPITGKGAHCLIIDDPVKDAEEADSENIRNSTWNWYGSTAYTRLAPGGGAIVCQTRWHHDDLSGRILREQREAYAEVQEKIEYLQRVNAPEDEIMFAFQEMDAIEEWDTVVFPAIAESDEYLDRKGKLVYTDGWKHRLLRKKNEALHPERYPLSDLLKKKRTLQPRHWTALYQQNPTPDEGDYFKKEMFRYEGDIDYRMMVILIAWDLAIGEKQQNDWTVGTVGALDWNGDLHLLDQVRFRSAELAKPILDLGYKYHPELIGIEKGQLEKAIMPELRRQMNQRRYFPPLAEGKEALVPVTDKVVRARPLQGLMQNGKVYFPAHQPWVEACVTEFLQFPNGLYDDRVDSVAWLARMASNHSLPKPPAERFHIKVPSWKDKLLKPTRKHPMAA